MTSRYEIAQAVRRALLVGALCAGAPAVAQEATDQEEAGAASLEEVVVTGSRIAQPNLESVSPLQVIGAEDIDAAGAPNVQDVLLQNPTVGTPTISRTNSNFSTSSAGVATVDLRNLGISRTLVLVNGRRFVAGIPGESAVDLNVIPQQFIERVDVLTGGASAAYGSDAVAGVVNIIYKNNFEGIELDTQYGASSESDDRQAQASLTMGTNIADGRGNIAVHLGYTEQGAVYSRNRPYAAVDQASVGAFITGDPADLLTIQRPFFSSFAPQGRFFSGDDQYTFDQAGQLVSGWSTNGSATTPARGFNRSAFRTIAIPTERWLFATRGNFEIVENHSVFLEGTYASSTTETELEPYPLGSEDIFPATGGQFPIEFERFVTGTGGTITRELVRNPLVPTAIFNSATDTDDDGLRDLYFTRRMSDLGNRGNIADRDTFRLVGGVEGEVFGGWRYDAYYGYGQTKEAQTSSGQVNVLNFRNALEVVPDADDVDGDGNVTEGICRDAGARAQGCVPANIYAGANGLAGAAADYIKAPGSLTTFTSQVIGGVNLSGEVFQLPAGGVGLAVGGEYREEFSRSEFDALQQAGLNAGNAIPATRGKFDVIEGYVETNVPLLKDLPFVQSLSLRAAARFSDYSTVGNTTSWNAGLEWSPISQLRFRGILAESVRAPNINELYSPPSQTFPADLSDPCVGVTATTSGAIATACRAAPGVNANIAANGAFTLNQSDAQGISGFDRGNPLLEEEKGKSMTLGVVITPEGVPVLENFGFTIDYFDIDIEDAIVSTPRQFILDQCYGGDAAFCSFITRRPAAIGANSAGSIEFIDSAQTNSGGYVTKGVDLTMTWRQDLEEWGVPGAINARLAYTHLLEGYLIPLPGAERDYFEGEVGAAADRAFLSLGYRLANFNATWRTTFIGESDFDDTYLAAFDLERGALGVGSVTYHDVQLTYSAADRYEIFVGANNVFDKQPPLIISGLSFNVTGAETDSGTYDAIGRRFYGGVRVKF